MKRVAKPKPGATAKRIVIAKRWWDDGERQVDLIEYEFSDSKWEVYLPDGTWIGTVGRYTGSLDRPIARGSRIRRAGKRRTLWSERGTHDDARTFHGEVSRADAIRSLIAQHERRGTL